MPTFTVGTSGVAVLIPNATRKAVMFENTSTSGEIRLMNAAASAITYATADIRLPPGSFKVFNAVGGMIEQVTAEYSAIADSAGNGLLVKEFYGDGQVQVNGGTVGSSVAVSHVYYYNGTGWTEAGFAGLDGVIVAITDHDGENTAVLDSEPIPASGNLTHNGLDISSYSKVSVQVSATTNCTAYPQVSDDNVNFYDIKTVADANISFNCNNEKICFEVPHIARYLRVFITNATASEGTITAVINGQA